MNSVTVATRPWAPAGGGPRHRSRLVLTVLLLVALIVPVTAASASASTTTVNVYFTPVDSECDATRPYAREVEPPRVLAGAIEQLLAGPTAAERAAGATSYLFDEQTAGMFRSATIRDGVAHIDFHDLRTVIPNASSSCGSTSLLAQLDATATQFPTVLRARYSINGSEATFYHWLQRDVPAPSRETATRGSLTNRAKIEDLDGDEATLRRIRVGRHDGFDRVVFEFDGGRPAYSVSYAPVAQADGSGAPIPTQGTVALQVYLQAESLNSEPLGPEFTFQPTEPITPGYPTLRHVRYGGFFEGGTTFGVGLTGRSGFRVVELTGPTRLAIDVAHGADLRDLRSGDRGSDVGDWQRRLNMVQFGTFASSPGHSQGPLTADGVFGTKTLRATRTFQRAEGVTETGVVNAATRSAMYQALRRSAQIRP
jgi:Putative peptidoglycan binding domain/Sporulation and spore germination